MTCCFPTCTLWTVVVYSPVVSASVIDLIYKKKNSKNVRKYNACIGKTTRSDANVTAKSNRTHVVPSARGLSGLGADALRWWLLEEQSRDSQRGSGQPEAPPRDLSPLLPALLQVQTYVAQTEYFQSERREFLFEQDSLMESISRGTCRERIVTHAQIHTLFLIANLKLLSVGANK